MSDDWKVGDLALCIESGKVTREGVVYTVSDVQLPGELRHGFNNGEDFPLLDFFEIPAPPNEASDGRRFRKIRPDEHEPCEEEFVTLIKRSKLPMTAALSRFGDVPADFVEAEMRVVKMEQDALEWARSTRLVRKQGDRS